MSAAKARDDVDWDTLPGIWQKGEQPVKSRPVRSSFLFNAKLFVVQFHHHGIPRFSASIGNF